MNPTDISRQTRVENQMLNYLVEGLRSTMAWEIEGQDASRKLSTLRFIAQSYQRHLEHLFALEELEGYMDLVLQTCPFMSKDVEVLKNEHESFRGEVRLIVQKLERVSPTDRGGLGRICDHLTAHLNRLDHHHGQEIELLQEAFERESGGEG